MHDVISKTLPTSEAELRRRAILELAEADLRIQDAQMQDSAMIEADLTRGATKPVPAAEDPLAAVRDAIDDLLQAAVEDAIDRECNRAGHYTRDPESMDGYIESVIDEVKRLLLADRMAFIASVQKPTTPPAADNGLLTSHNPDRRGVL